MHLSGDEVILWRFGFLKLNLTIAMTWATMAVLAVGSALITRRLSGEVTISKWQSFLEIIVTMARSQIEEVGLKRPEKYLPYIASLFLFIALANLCTIIPGYEPPTGSLSTTTALALSVFVAVPVFGISEKGVLNYFRTYAEPTIIMLPFNIIGEFTRTMALAVRLFGNMMSGVMILAILLTISPLIFPVLMNILGLLTGMVQAYIFSILATVYIAAATRDKDEPQPQTKPEA
jgi:F-type H+-transporting ATPase subunit a